MTAMSDDEATRPAHPLLIASVAAALGVSLAAVDGLMTIMSRHARFATPAGALQPTAALALVGTVLALVALAPALGLARRRGWDRDALAVASATAAFCLFASLAAAGLLKWPLYVTDALTLALISPASLALGWLLYGRLRDAPGTARARTFVGVLGVLPLLLLLTSVVCWLNLNRLGSLFAASSLMVNAMYALAVLGIVVVAGRIPPWMAARAPLLLLPIVVAAAAATARRPAARPWAAADASHPRIVLISVDTLRADTLSAYNSAALPTPHVDQLAREGVLFERAVSPAPWTLPAMASIMTGLVPEMRAMNLTEASIPDAATTLAERLHGAGYTTGAIGENELLRERSQNFAKGFDSYRFFPPLPADSSVGTAILARLRPRDYATESNADELTDLALQWLEAHADARSFLWLHYYDPHHPLRPSAEDRRRAGAPADMPKTFSSAQEVMNGTYVPDAKEREWIRALYRAEVQAVDRNVGRLLERLRTMGRYEDTIVVLVADHGEEFWEHHGFGHGGTLYQELLAVPLVFKGPGIVPARVTTRVSTVDTLPTILDLARVPYAADSLDGRSLRPVWDRPGSPEHELPITIGATVPRDPLVGAILSGTKFTRSLRTAKTELFELDADPGETRPLAGRPELAQRAERLLESSGRRAAQLRARTGGGEPTLANEERIERLRALGYLN